MWCGGVESVGVLGGDRWLGLRTVTGNVQRYGFASIEGAE